MCFDNCKKIFKLDGILERHGNLLFIFSIILLAIELSLAATIVTENIIHQPLVGVNQANIHVFSFPRTYNRVFHIKKQAQLCPSLFLAICRIEVLNGSSASSRIGTFSYASSGTLSTAWSTRSPAARASVARTCCEVGTCCTYARTLSSAARS